MSITSHLPALGGDYENIKSQQEAQREASLLTPEQDKQLQVDLREDQYRRNPERRP